MLSRMWCVLVWLGVAGCGSAGLARPPAPPAALELLGHATIPAGMWLDTTEVGGLSGLAYDPGTGHFLAISDNRGAPSIFVLALDLSTGHLSEGGVRVVGVTRLRGRDGAPYPPRTVDAEGIVRLDDGSLVISSEGTAAGPPFVRRFSTDGCEVGRVELPAHVVPRAGGGWGVRDNLALESLTATPDGRFCVTATENALAQDGPAADLPTGSPARILRFSLPDGAPAGEFVYQVAPVPRPPSSPDGFRTNGLPDLLALDPERFLALERASVDGVGHEVRLFLVSLAGATDVSAVPSLTARGVPAFRPVAKRLLLDLGALGIRLQNLEGMALGPVLPDGRRVLVMVADNNFGTRGATTQLLALALRREALEDVAPRRPTISAIQGAAHASGFLGEEVAGVAGVVTALVEPGAEPGFWMQALAPDTDDRTSDGIFVASEGSLPAVAVGDEVRVDGRVDELLRGLDLPVTRLVAGRIEVVGSDRPLPPPVVIGPDGRRPPEDVIEDDGFTVCDPDRDGADFFESLEGMRVMVRHPVVVGPTSEHGELVVMASPPVSRRTARGGVAIAPGRFNPQRITVSGRLLPAVPAVAVGDRFAGALQGVLDYAFGTYRLVLTERPPAVVAGGRAQVAAGLTGGPDRLTVATFNVENLALTSSDSKLAKVAAVVASALRGPDIVALQEIQDDSGPADDGVTSARGTLGRLVDRIAAAGGPHYDFRQIDPENNRDGGAPGGNIRVALLFNPVRVRFVDRGTTGPGDAARLVSGPQGVMLAPSPGRVEPESEAWRLDRPRGFEASRRPLAGELRFGDHTLVVVVVHLRSKGGDAPLLGRVQPPTLPSERQRHAQAEVVRGFVAGILGRDPGAAVVVLGDCNEFQFAPPLATLVTAPLVNLVDRLEPADRYTYVFQGNSQVLDHILVSPALAAAAEIAAVHVNADLPDDARASDHDPLLAVLPFR